MGELKVIAIPPEDVWPRSDNDGLYHVVMGDCILPGFTLGKYATEAEADQWTKHYADHYRLKAFPIDGPWRKRSRFRLIQGGVAGQVSPQASQSSGEKP